MNEGNKTEKQYGINVGMIRESKGMTQKELADALKEKAGFDATRVYVTKIENGDVRLRAECIVALSKALGVTCDEILTGTKPENVQIARELGLSNQSIESLKQLKQGASGECIPPHIAKEISQDKEFQISAQKKVVDSILLEMQSASPDYKAYLRGRLEFEKLELAELAADNMDAHTEASRTLKNYRSRAAMALDCINLLLSRPSPEDFLSKVAKFTMATPADDPNYPDYHSKGHVVFDVRGGSSVEYKDLLPFILSGLFYDIQTELNRIRDEAPKKYDAYVDVSNGSPR